MSPKKLHPLKALAFLLVVVACLVVFEKIQHQGQGSQDDPKAGPTATAQAQPNQSPAATGTPSTPEPSQSPNPGPTSTAVQQDGTALTALNALPVKGRAPKTGYSRAQFGERWTDNNVADLGGTSRNGCDTRNDILRRDMTDLLVAKNGCKVLTGHLVDPYTGKQIAFVCGIDAVKTSNCDNKLSQDVQIDHVVALSDAWQKGAQALTLEQRTALANDPINLYAVDGPTNTAKSDADAASWLPEVKAFRCTYVAHQVAVKTKYQLWVTQAEKDKIAEILGTCPGSCCLRAEQGSAQPIRDDH